MDGVKTREGKFWFYALTGQYAVTEKWSIVLEFYGQEQGKAEIESGEWTIPNRGCSMSCRVWAGIFPRKCLSWPAFLPGVGEEQPRNDYSGGFFLTINF